MPKEFKPRPGVWNRPRNFRWSREVHRDGQVVIWKISRRIGLNFVSIQVALSRYDIFISSKYAVERLRDARRQLREFVNA